VIILNKGRAVYQGATSSLLAGSGGRILVKFREAARGVSDRLRTRLEDENWLDEITALENGAERGWIVTMPHRGEGVRRLLETLVRESGLELYHFEEKKQRLEEIFLELTKKGDCRES
jgi:ABC-type multidrug transport system ATPase subunit